jgi:hypothetical protein
VWARGLTPALSAQIGVLIDFIRLIVVRR